MAGRVLIHLPRDLFDELADGHAHFYTRLRATLQGLGAVAEFVVRAPGNAPPAADDGDFHFVHQAGHRQANVLNTGLGYVQPFWYADPWGIHGDSSIAALRFDPAAVPRAEAQAFHRRLHRRLVAARLSRYDQKAEVESFPGGAIAVFLQGPSDLLFREAHLSTPDMLRMVLRHAGDRPVLVKPHPRGRDPETLAFLDELVLRHPRLVVTDANIHDMLAAAAVSVSINSAVSLESMIHGKPAILCGRSDFHHVAETVREKAEFPAALRRALARPRPYAKFLYWFLKGQMLTAGAEDFGTRLVVRMAVQAGDVARFGLQAPAGAA